MEKTLHEPMYLFLCNLCFNGLYGTTGFYPKLIYDLFSPVQRLIVACRQSNESRKRFMQTCVPHLVSLINFTITLLFDILFSRYGSEDFPIGVRYFLQLEILIVPPLLNPLMYGLKLSEVRKRIFQMHKR
ncbi:olfactory receptor 51G1-like [Clarias gariepinus]